MSSYTARSFMGKNVDSFVIRGFGDEWTRFDQSRLSRSELIEIFNSYFSIFPWSKLPENSIGFDLGCGSGRWADLVATRVGHLHCIDASQAALNVAKENLAGHKNCYFHLASVDDLPLPDESADFGYSLGVLHHIPDTEAGIRACASKLKHGAPFLLYLYYAFDNKPFFYRMIWKVSEIFRFLISRAPLPFRYLISQAIAVFVYFPLARSALLIESLGFKVDYLPLSFYRKRSFYVMRTDALDRFGTRLEKRYTKKQIAYMMDKAGLENIIFSNSNPFWCAVGFKK